MIAEILSTGDEICQGSVIDSNSAHIAVLLNEIGAHVTRHSCVGDNMDELASMLSEIAVRADIAVITGGLGPTIDDLSAEAAAKAFGVDLQLDPDAAKSIKTYFAKFSRKMSRSDIKQAMLPAGASPIVNAYGTAPGFIFNIGRCRCYFLPGVPKEMERMVSEAVVPDILAFFGEQQDTVTLRKQLSLFGLPEALVNEKLNRFESLFPNVKLGMLARFPVITVKMTAVGTDRASLVDEIEKAGKWSAEQLGDKVFSLEGRSMEAEIASLLIKSRVTIGVAESCTGGLIAHLLTNIAGSSDYFLFSGVTYSNEAKVSILGVSEKTLKTYGAVSEETVREMADGARRISGATCGLATSGIAGPTGGTDEKPVGTVCVGISMKDKTLGYRFHSPFKERLSNKQIFAICALDLLRKQILMAS
ncbi:MAG: CinA family nicotinamide mononucleotide deamidase-related protein [Desulfobacteraceae bacterium]|nr:CinA family nicotinamide mononucleotide deamidase-related protein [Desulfobacteraceae bacterium]MBC2755669.1 CinA family nicotinamide mononucleotide deamidase-related protein [Desulfobacteraceae bacterium]